MVKTNDRRRGSGGLTPNAGAGHGNRLADTVEAVCSGPHSRHRLDGSVAPLVTGQCHVGAATAGMACL